METGSTTHPRAAAQNESERGQPTSEDIEYVGMRVDGTPLVLKLTDHERLTPDRSLELVRHSPGGFDWGYTGSGLRNSPVRSCSTTTTTRASLTNTTSSSAIRS